MEERPVSWQHAIHRFCVLLTGLSASGMPGCAAAGALIEEGGTAAASIGTASFFGPGIGWLSSFLWKLLFGWTATEITGTTSTRVDAAGKEVSGTDGVGIGEIEMFDSPLLWLIIAAFVLHNGGLAWLKSNLGKKVVASDAKRDAHNAAQDLQIRDLQSHNTQLQRDIDRLQKNWDNLE